MEIYIIPFLILVLAFFIYLRKDSSEWKLVNDRLSLFTSSFNSKLNEAIKSSKDADESNKALRESLMSQKVTTDNLQDHCHRLQQTVLLLEGKLRIMQDQITGFRITLPETVSIQVTKDVKNASNRSQQRKAEAKKPDNKVRGKKSQAGSNIKRDFGISSNR